MNKTRQFWALVKFQVAINPFVIAMPLVIAMPYYMPYFARLRDYRPNLDLLVQNQFLFFVAILGFLVLAPEIMRSGAYSAAWPTGTEFLLTRAVDRYLVFRARTAFFYFLILVIPLFALLGALRNPSLQISEFDKALHRQILDQIPGSMSAPANPGGRGDLITIPNGNALVESWRAWQFLFLAVATQVFVLLIYRLKYRRFILWATYMGLAFLPLIILSTFGYKGGRSASETTFFVFVSHQWLFWLITIAALILGQAWCERRFATLEQ